MNRTEPPLSFTGNFTQQEAIPQEAIDACLNKEKGTACEVITPRGDTLSGQCKTTRDNKYFVCKPDRRPQRPNQN